MTQTLRVLMVEDSEYDATLLQIALRHGGYEVDYAVVDTPAAMRAALKRPDWDVITSDHAMPRFSAPAALALAKELRPDLPFIIVSGEIDINLAVSLMKDGATDYIQKHELPRVVPMIERALHEAELRRERQQVNEALEVSETRYRRLFETASERTAQLEALNQELEAFSSSVSHDLHAPLRWIMGFAEALRDDYADKQSSDSLRLIENIRVSAQRMNALINGLLQLARFSHSELIRHPVDLSAVVQRVAAELRQSDPTRRVEFTIADHLTANVDEQMLLIVMENLLGNAWKFTSQRAPAQIEFGAALQADGSVAYFVRDNGAGFDMANVDRLFTPFQRLHNQNEFPGIGIGLATVQRIVHRHAGRVWAEGVVDKGATFYFTIGEA